MRAITAGTASGLLLWLSLPPVGLGALAWIALLPAASVALAGGGWRGRAAVPIAYVVMLELLLVPALPLGVADGQWGDPALPVMTAGSPVLFVALVAVPLLGLLLFAVGFGSPLRLGRGRAATVLGCVAVPAVAWALLDYLRVSFDPGSFWGPLFLSQATGAPGDVFAWLGPWLTTAAIVAFNYGLAVTIRSTRPRLALAATGGLFAALALSSPLSGATAGSGESLRVAAIQPGYDTAEDRPVLRRFERGSYDLAALDLIADLGGLSRRAAARGAELIVWPEAVIWVDPRADRRVAERLGALARETDATLIVPFFLPDESRGGALAVHPRPAGEDPLSEARHKHRAMWYLGERSGGPGGTGPLDAEPARIGLMLGVDTAHPPVARSLADAGAELLVSVTHDWRQLAGQQRSYARLAARLAGLPLVRADWRYGSTVYDAEGRPLAEAGSDRRRAIITADLSL
jgi:apolipoprotein N-acyltransferase